MNELARRIRQKREQLGLSQEELAKRLGYKSRSTINKIELGINDIPQSKIELFADALETSPAYLLGYDHPSLIDISSLPSTDAISYGLKQLREDMNLSLKDFAGKIGVTQETYSLWESGEETPSKDMLLRISGLLNISVDFFNGQDRMIVAICYGLLSFLRSSHMSIDELAQKINVDSSDLEAILETNDYKIFELSNKIADIFKMEETEFLEAMWSRNKPVSEEDRLREENNELFDRLPKDKQQEALNYLRFLVEHQGKE